MIAEVEPLALQIAELSFTSSWQLPAHVHLGFNETLLIVRGRLEVRTGEQVITGKVGDLLTYPQGVAHAERCTSDGGLKMLFAVWTQPSAIASRRPVVSRDHDGCALTLFQWMLRLPRRDDAMHQSLRNSALRIILHDHFGPIELVKNGWLAAVRAHVRQHLKEQVTIAELASVAQMSPFHFIRQFKQATGITPMQYVRQARVEAARMMLLASPMPLRKIAPAVGFRDEFELSRVFKRQTGQSPGRLRHQFMGGREQSH